MILTQIIFQFNTRIFLW